MLQNVTTSCYTPVHKLGNLIKWSFHEFKLGNFFQMRHLSSKIVWLWTANFSFTIFLTCLFQTVDDSLLESWGHHWLTHLLLLGSLTGSFYVFWPFQTLPQPLDRIPSSCLSHFGSTPSVPPRGRLSPQLPLRAVFVLISPKYHCRHSTLILTSAQK